MQFIIGYFLLFHFDVFNFVQEPGSATTLPSVLCPANYAAV
jgi:hypothetical protein